MLPNYFRTMLGNKKGIGHNAFEDWRTKELKFSWNRQGINLYLDLLVSRSSFCCSSSSLLFLCMYGCAYLQLSMHVPKRNLKILRMNVRDGTCTSSVPVVKIFEDIYCSHSIMYLVLSYTHFRVQSISETKHIGVMVKTQRLFFIARYPYNVFYL